MYVLQYQRPLPKQKNKQLSYQRQIKRRIFVVPFIFRFTAPPAAARRPLFCPFLHFLSPPPIVHFLSFVHYLFCNLSESFEANENVWRFFLAVSVSLRTHASKNGWYYMSRDALSKKLVENAFHSVHKITAICHWVQLSDGIRSWPNSRVHWKIECEIGRRKLCWHFVY